MAVTLELTQSNGSASEVVHTGTPLAVAPSTGIRVRVDGGIIDPNAITIVVVAPHVTLILLGGETVRLLGFVDLTGDAGGGLVGADGGVVIASTLAALTAAADGESGPSSTNPST